MPTMLQKRKYPRQLENFQHQEIKLKKTTNRPKIEEDSFEDFRFHSEKALKEIWDNKEDERWSQELLTAANSARTIPLHKSKRK